MDFERVYRSDLLNRKGKNFLNKTSNLIFKIEKECASNLKLQI